MSQLNFFTAVSYATPPESIGSFLLENVDNYFYLGGKKAHVIPGKTKSGQERVILSETNSSLLARVCKVFSYFTILIPIFMLIAKVILRSTHSFKLIDPKKLLEKYYKNKHIVTGKEPFQVDIDSLGLDLGEEGEISVFVKDVNKEKGREKQTITMRTVVIKVIKEINRLIQNNSDKKSIQETRYIALIRREEPFCHYTNLGNRSDSYLVNEEEAKQLWLYRIIKALNDNGHIFKFSDVPGGFWIQA